MFCLLVLPDNVGKDEQLNESVDNSNCFAFDVHNFGSFVFKEGSYCFSSARFHDHFCFVRHTITVPPSLLHPQFLEICLISLIVT